MSFAHKKCEGPGGADFATNHSATAPESVTSIVMSIWSPKDIVTGSVLEVTQPDTYENHLPKPNGLFDARMGVIENGQVCETCKQNNHNCTGHFGHITLAKPVYYMQMLQIVLKVLKCVCWRCSKCLLKKDDKTKIVEGKTKFKARFATVLGKCQSYQKTGKSAMHLCDNCNAKQPKYSLKKDKQSKTNGGLTNIYYNKDTLMTVDNVLLILKRITDEEVELIGLSPKYSRPDWMICTVLPVPPPHVRPSVRQDGNQKAEDDLTHKLSDIVKANNTLRQKIQENKDLEKIEECYGFLQYHVATFMDNDMPGVLPASQRGSGRPLKSLKQRLNHKEGRMRNNLMGKRCNFTARSVISPDANIALDELGVPLSIATNLTFPVTVTKLNLAELTKYVKNRDNYPGAKSVVKAASGRRYCLAYAPADLKLECGDVVNRHMMDGDVVLFNRQPSLHKMSMMGHRVRVLPYGMTFRLNLSVTTPYNADFDGDEMNAHLPQSCQTQAELKYLTLVPSQLISPQKSAPVMGIVQDSLLAGNLMTKAGSIALNAREVCRLLMWNDAFNGNMALSGGGGGAWTGQRLFAQLLPEIINLTRGNTQTAITSYHHMTGMLDKSILGSSAGGLIHILYKDYGEQVAADFMYATQRLVNNWLLINGFSVGMSDCLVPANDITIVTTHLGRRVPSFMLAEEGAAKEEVMTIGQYTQEIIGDVQTKVLATLQESYDSPDADLEELELKIKQQLNTGRDLIGKVILNDKTPNRLTDMIKAESKGNPLNIAQIRGCLGQSEVEGKRAPLNMDRRSLPFYARDDNSAAARGFIANSFLTGITPQEYVFHAMAGRIGIIDTAVRTSETGYIQRRLIKTMEDVCVSPDHTVRDAMGNIIEFQYGEDGYDACRLETISSNDAFNFHTVATHEFNNRFVHQFERLYWETYLIGIDTLTVYDETVTMDMVQQALDEEYTKLVECKEEFRRKISVFEERLSSPIHLERVIKNVQAKHNPSKAAIGFVQLSPYTTYTMVKAKITEMKKLVMTQSSSEVYRKRAGHTLFILETLMRVCLHSKVVMTTLKLSREALAEVLHECYKMFLRGLVNPGEMVGIIASQSIGEPATQMCVDGAEVVTVWNATTRQCYHGPIGPWLDGLLHDKAATNVVMGDRFLLNNMEGEGDEYYIHGVDMKTEKMPQTYRIRQISRLPANGQMLKITTRTGRTVTATMSHAFLRRSASGLGGMEKATGASLRVGQRIPVAFRLPQFDAAAAQKTYFDLTPEAFGSLLGWYLSNGSLEGLDTVRLHSVPTAPALALLAPLQATAAAATKEEQDTTTTNITITHAASLVAWLHKEAGGAMGQRRVPACVFAAPLACAAALLRCYLDGDGNIAAQKHTIRCCSTSRTLIDDICLLFAYFDMVPYKFVDGSQLYHLGLCTKYGDQYVKCIGSHIADKRAALASIVAHNHRDDCKSQMEFMDKIPHLGSLLTSTAKRLGLPRGCEQWVRRESIGRRTLGKYIRQFEELGGAPVEMAAFLQAYDCDVLWDQITNIEIIPENTQKLVYDLSVEGAETFMLGSGILVHNTLNTFHNTGVSAKSQTTTGVPRLKELLNISKNPKTPSLDIMLQPAYARDEDTAMQVGHMIAITSVKDILATSFLKLQKFPAGAVAGAGAGAASRQQVIDVLLHDNKLEDGHSYLMVCLEFKKQIINDRQLVMATIQSKMEQQSESSKIIRMTKCITSDDNAHVLLCLCLFDLSQEINTVQNVRHWYKHVGEITICGKAKIHQAYPMECLKKYLPYAAAEDGSFGSKKEGSEYMLRTDGSNLEDIINMAEIDATRTISNNVNEIYHLFGIEAARQALMEEFINTLSQTSAYVNYRHICLLVDVMTNKGVLLSIDIHGVKKGDIGPLARASFEETVDQLVKSACYAEKDKMSGVSANIMLGQVPPTGTGTVKLLFDERKMKAQMPVLGCDDPNHFAFDFKPIVKSTLLPRF
jgi:DNA-directed RNA polymerase beta' subunit